jgi:hypothetical protein
MECRKLPLPLFKDDSHDTTSMIAKGVMQPHHYEAHILSVEITDIKKVFSEKGVV